MNTMKIMFAALVLVATTACGDEISKGKYVPQNSGTSNASANNTSANNTSANNTTANNTSANNTTATSGNGTVEGAETCDPAIADGTPGACPSSCTSRACTTTTLIGSADQCSAECSTEPVGCIDDDGCCTAGCTSETDSDCVDNAMCGNGTTEPGELCDGDCPTSCPPGPTACTPLVLTGSPNQCNSRCVQQTVTSCVRNDGCCPSGCTAANDNDCTANCTPDTCAQLGATCGRPPDGCGGTLSCGSCSIGTCTDSFVCSNIGDACAADADCKAGDLTARCLVDEPDGYCTGLCTTNDVCPGDAFCSATIFQDGVCNLRCSTDADCRTGYECRALTEGGTELTCLPIESM